MKKNKYIVIIGVDTDDNMQAALSANKRKKIKVYLNTQKRNSLDNIRLAIEDILNKKGEIEKVILTHPNLVELENSNKLSIETLREIFAINNYFDYEGSAEDSIEWTFKGLKDGAEHKDE